MPEKCHVVNCTRPTVAKGLCGTHYKRLARTGATDQTRAEDWGAREQHPAYRAWCGLVRHHRHRMDPRWLADFWAFVADVPEKPAGEKSQASRASATDDWGPGNFYWRTSRLSAEARADKAEGMREWHRKARAADPDYGRNAALKKNYGVTLEWFREQYSAQKGVCLICQQPETARIRGKAVSLSVDHCHETQRVRGLLCSACNRALGAFKHDANILQKAIDYLALPPMRPSAPGGFNAKLDRSST